MIPEISPNNFCLDFVHFDGMSGEYYFPEIMGAGGAVFDYDNDGDLDIYLVQVQMLGPGKTLADAVFPPHKGTSLTDRLYRNADGTFTDVTAEAGVEDRHWSVSASFFDFDGDGWLDLYVGNYGEGCTPTAVMPRQTIQGCWWDSEMPPT
jgi:hypothetical protein